MELTPVMEKFVLHWGEMGTRWGVNRSVAQVHALLFLSERPLNAEEITETLSIARSNVSTSLKELQGWGLVHLTHVMGDRRDHFASEKDTWEILRLIAEGRKKREIDPTLTTVRQCALEAGDEDGTPPEARERIADVLAFLEELDDWYTQVHALPKPTLVRLIKMGGKVAQVAGKF